MTRAELAEVERSIREAQRTVIDAAYRQFMALEEALRFAKASLGKGGSS